MTWLGFVLCCTIWCVALAGCGADATDGNGSERRPDRASPTSPDGTTPSGRAPSGSEQRGRDSAAAGGGTSEPPRIGNGKTVTIAFGGDVNYDGPLRTLLATRPETMLAGVQPVLSAADLTIVNLETSIGSGGTKQAKAFTFQAPATAFGALRTAGVDVIGMANNHALDYGQDGLDQTLAAIEADSVPVIGIGHDEDEAFRPFVASVKGQRIAFIAATEVIDSNLITSWTATTDHAGVASAKRIDRLTRAVREARRGADTVVVFLHWGTETQHCPDADQQRLAPALVSAGADVVVGGHAHRVQGGGYLGDAFVDYGLGNFQFRANSPEGRESGVLTVTVTGRRVAGAVWSPASVGADALPRLLTGDAARAAQDRWVGYRTCAKLAGKPKRDDDR